jgi:cytochrome c peroxidase
MRKSLTVTLQGKEPSDEDVQAMLAYLKTLRPPPNPNRRQDGSLTPAAVRGERVFRSDRAGCADCHAGPYFTDGLVHDVGLGSPTDRYEGFNTPSLVDVYRRVLLLHDGRAKSLDELLTGPHDPDKVTGLGPLSEAQLRDLIAYLRSL